MVAEGPREVMKLWQEGYTNSVAVMGSHLSDSQHRLLAELGPKRLALMFDGDDAGVATTERIAARLRKTWERETTCCFVPKGKDPKNLDREDFRRLLGW